jgi:hypothetical protein
MGSCLGNLDCGVACRFFVLRVLTHPPTDLPLGFPKVAMLNEISHKTLNPIAFRLVGLFASSRKQWAHTCSTPVLNARP